MNRVHFLLEDQLWVWLDSFSEVTPAKVARLFEEDRDHAARETVRTIRSIYEMNYSDYLRCGLDETTARVLADRKDLSETVEKLESWKQQGIEAISCENPRFPKALIGVVPPVRILYALGHHEWLEELDRRIEMKRTLSIVGSRRCTNYGSGAAKYLASNLAAAGFWIISGMAGGIDSYAHEGALNEGGKTIAVLGCGVDVCYPSSNRGIYKKIRKDGLLLSEYQPGENPLSWHFPLRNRIIAALGSALVVAEAAKDSGSMITVDQALELDRPIFAVPGPLFQKNSEGTNRLIFQGAFIITEWNDVADALGGVDPSKRENEEPQEEVFEDRELQQVYQKLGWVSRSAEEINQELELSPGRLLRDLTILELEGYILRTGEDRYMKKKRG